MQSFAQSYECRLDDKARLRLPAPILRDMEAAGFRGLIIKRSALEKCLEIHTPAHWEARMQQLSALNPLVPDHARMIRLYTIGVRHLEVDASGRIQIPRDLVQSVDIDREVVLSTSITHLELWNREIYQNYLSEAVNDFSTLAERIFNPNLSSDVS